MSEEKRNMTFLQKVENFWYYNKWVVALVILAIVTVILSAKLILDNDSDKARDLTVVCVYSQELTSEDSVDISKKLEQGISDVNNDGKINAESKIYYISETAQSDEDKMAQGRFDAILQKYSGDIMIFDEPNLNLYLKKDIFEPIEKYMDLSNISEEDIVYRNDVAVAVKLSQSQILKDINFKSDDVYAGIMFIPDNATEELKASRENAKIAISDLVKKAE